MLLKGNTQIHSILTLKNKDLSFTQPIDWTVKSLTAHIAPYIVALITTKNNNIYMYIYHRHLDYQE